MLWGLTRSVGVTPGPMPPGGQQVVEPFATATNNQRSTFHSSVVSKSDRLNHYLLSHHIKSMESSELPFPHPRQRASADEIRYSKNAIAKLDKDIEDLEAKLQDLRRKRANYESYIAPIRRMPAEILSEIIHFCLQNGIRLSVMTQICGYFRDVILGMTSIWSNILLVPRNRAVSGYPSVAISIQYILSCTNHNIDDSCLQNCKIPPSGSQTCTVCWLEALH
jgi:hypothetical protein